MKKLFSLFLALTLLCAAAIPAMAEETDRAAALRASFLAKADEVVVTDDSVIFPDAASETPLEIAKNPSKPAVLYGSFVTLWYEAGGKAAGVIGGDSSIALYNLYIGRDVTQDEGVTVLAESSAGKNWSTENIIAFQPDLIICSTAMSGYKTISAPAEAANIPVVAMDYNDFSDYLKWFKVFCNLNGQPELWDSVAMPALELTLTDAQEQAVLRRVLSPEELAAPPDLAAGAVWNGTVSVQVAATVAPQVAGYRLLAFYP